jgi:hypothetical protein
MPLSKEFKRKVFKEAFEKYEPKEPKLSEDEYKIGCDNVEIKLGTEKTTVHLKIGEEVVSYFDMPPVCIGDSVTLCDLNAYYIVKDIEVQDEKTGWSGFIKDTEKEKKKELLQGKFEWTLTNSDGEVIAKGEEPQFIKYAVSEDVCISKLQESPIGPITMNACQHEWVSADNEVVTGGEICTKCHKIRTKQK